MQIIVIKPDYNPCDVRTEGSLRVVKQRQSFSWLQREVSGWVEEMPLGKLKATNRTHVFGNEEGRLSGLPVNVYASGLLGYEAVGTIVICEGECLAEEEVEE